MILSPLQLLPLLYLQIVLWVISATVLGKIFGPSLLKRTTGVLHNLLAKPIPILVTGDHIYQHVLDAQLLQQCRTILLFKSAIQLLLNGLGVSLQQMDMVLIALRKVLTPEQYWSGCPPNL